MFGDETIDPLSNFDSTDSLQKITIKVGDLFPVSLLS